MKVAVTWQMCGYVEIDEPTMKECMDYFNENSIHIELPMDNAEYVESSFELSSDDEDVMEIMSRQGGELNGMDFVYGYTLQKW